MAKINEISIANSDPFITKIMRDLTTTKQQLLLEIIADSTNEMEKYVALLQQMDLVYEITGQATIKFQIDEAALRVLIIEIKRFDDAEMNESLNRLEQEHAVYWQCGSRRYNLTDRPLIYAILNITSDSFYDGGRFQLVENQENQIKRLVDAGADVIEVGGQTTRPGDYVELSPEDEIKAIEPVIKMIQRIAPGMAIAVDSYKYDVQKAVIDLGVDIINDVNAFTDDPRKLDLMADSSVGLLTMHSARSSDYTNLTDEMKKFFESNLQDLMDAGIDRDRIALDQGVGYNKVADGYQDYAMMRNIDQFNYLKRPMMVAISRKGFGKKLFNLPVDDRLGVTLIAESYMYLHGGRILRVHDVEETVQLVKMLNVIRAGYWFGSEKNNVSK